MKGTKKRGLDRRKFLKTGAGAALLAGAPFTKAKAAKCPAAPAVLSSEKVRPALADLTGDRPPNLLLILTDQERWTGNLPSTLKRPQFDRLRGTAVSFDNTFCAYPLCSPSRSSIFSGQYPHQTGVTHNLIFPVAKKPLDPKAPHLGAVLASAGYRIGYKGKWDLSKGPTFYTANVKDRGRAGEYGYEGHCGKVPDQEYGFAADDQVVRESCDWIKAQDKNQPWFLCSSIINPHDICHPQLKPNQSVRPDVVLPKNLRDDLKSKPADQKRLRDSKLAHINSIFHPGAKATSDYHEEDWKLFLSFYYDLIESTDRFIGALFSALEDKNFLENTMIVYTSDHGELGGAHGFSGKNEGYEEDLHIPLYVSHPKLAGRKTAPLVSNISIAPTIAALAGTKWPAVIPGRDLTGWLSNDNGPKDDAVFAETETRVNAGVYKMNYATRHLRTVQYHFSYSFFEVQNGQLYDLSADPLEMNNLFHDPASAGLKKELADRLRAWQKESGDYFTIPG